MQAVLLSLEGYLSQASCPQAPITCFDITEAAGSYAQFAGILAAFAFGAIVLLLQDRESRNELQRDDSRQNVLISFFSAFFGLGVTTYLFALLSGEQSGAETLRTMISEYFASFALSVSVVPLFYGLLALLTALDLRTITRFGKFIFVCVLILLGLFMTVTARDALAVIQKQQVGKESIFLLMALGSGMVVGILIAVVLHARRSQFPIGLIIVLVIGIVISAIVVGITSWLPLQDEDSNADPTATFWIVEITLGLFGFLLALYGWQAISLQEALQRGDSS